MQFAYDYKEDLISKVPYADSQIELRQEELHEIMIEIEKGIEQLKTEFDITIRAALS